MDVFKLRDDLIGEYKDYAGSFLRILDDRVRDHVDLALNEGRLWPHPQIGLNPAFRSGGSIDSLVADGVLHPQCAPIFRVGKSARDAIGHPMTLHQHQVDAIRAARASQNYVLTTGTGSGKSLSYMVPIVDHVLRSGSGTGIKAVVVYPMNALANSQLEELKKFLDHGPWGSKPPVTFARYTGQESDEDRQLILSQPPDIILTNYVMLELILTRYRDRKLVNQLGDLRFLVLDELHTYRGRQGADVSLLVRRMREASRSENLLCVGTSATMSSEGTADDRRARVAKVASTLFGSEVTPSNVIGETLERATAEADLADPSFIAELTARVAGRQEAPTTYAEFVRDPLSMWIESTFGLREDETGRLVRAAPLSINGQGGGGALLAQLTNLDRPTCETAIMAQLLGGYAVTDAKGFPVFAFRLHQFLSRGDTVYASPTAPGQRYITLARQRFVPASNRAQVLFPLAFCRECGQDYYVVAKQPTDTGTVLVPRDLGDTALEHGQTAGFVFISEANPWPEDPHAAEDRLPEEWFDADGNIRGNRRDELPLPVAVRANGALDLAHDDPDATRGWWVEAPFRFCLACGVSYTGRLGRDISRLATLGSDGRSTATTIMSLAAVRHLRADGTLPEHARKLLSFTDNRQDASLQAGHFNDFVQVTLLRAALWRAVNAAGPAGIAHDDLPQKVFDALGLPFHLYARDADLMGNARRDTEAALREVLAYRLYSDLVRGWRLTQPNLEQCGLLRIEYESVDELARDDRRWADAHPALAEATPEKREFILRVLLDLIRRDLAIRVDVLDQHVQERMRARSDQRLAGAWSFEDEKLEYSPTVVPRARTRADVRDTVFVSARGGFGQFLRRSTELGAYGKLKLTDTDQIITELFDRLRVYGLLEIVSTDADGSPRYQMPASAMRWTAGDHTTPYQDHIRMPSGPPQRKVNSFFVDLYTALGRELIGVEAREHTAQVPYDERQKREDRFRTADLPVLYCSPTMELGVDIAQLNVVNMRNVPPTPANYAQRSGRAGRSGQPALVFTYCTAGSSHDQHYFRHPEQMVAGVVEAPRLELANEDLLRSHVHAVWLAESGLDLKTSMGAVLDLVDEVDEPLLFEHVVQHLDDPTTRARAKQRAEVVLADIRPLMTETTWWTESWLDDTLNAVRRRFEDSLGRWRSLYKSALQQAREQGRIKISATRSAEDRRQADRLRREAENQLEILRAESDSRSQSDFYTYRYFAAEGFLPGYSFPRLPLSAFIPGRRGRSDDPEFLQRPRFLAISEFGPQSLVYHEGMRYRINRVILPVGDLDSGDGSLLTQQAKRCETCGYLHPFSDAAGPDVCESCGVELPLALSNLFRMQNVSTVRRDRITSDEEERQRKGYEIISGVHFAKRRGNVSVRRATIEGPAGTAFELAYGDTATLWRINLGWRRRKVKEELGFVLDIERGYWGNANDAEAEDDQDPLSARKKRVVPFVEDSRNALIVKPKQQLPIETMASLQAALKVAMQVVFQLEEDEIAAEPLPSADDRSQILFYESAEGGAGALRRLVDDPRLWRRVAQEALRRCHIDPDDLGDIATLSGERCEAACYECLLSYRNQTEHQLLDRYSVRAIFEDLRDAVFSAEVAPETADMLKRIDSKLEADFLGFLTSGGYRTPDRSQVYLESAKTRPDFLYDEACAAIYIDGPHHDSTHRQIIDETQEAALHDLGYKVIRFHHRDDWAQIVATFRSVFGEGNG